MKKIYILLIAIITTASMNAQVSSTMYFMEGLPQNNQLNPAFQMDRQVFVGLPVLSSTGIHFSSNALAWSDVFEKNGNALQANFTSLVDNLKDVNLLNFNADISLFSLGVKINKDDELRLDVRNRGKFNFGIPKDMVVLLVEGNEAFIDKTARFGNFELDMLAFTEIGIGFSHKVNDELTLGVRPKLIFGHGIASIEKAEISMYTDPQNYYIDLQASTRLNFSAPVALSENAEGKVDDIQELDNIKAKDFLRNKGFAIDLGGVYKINDEITVSASLLDLGTISWKHNAYSLRQDSAFTYRGVNLNGEFSYRDDTDYAEELVDSIADVFAFESSGGKFSSGLFTSFVAGGSYQLNEFVKFGLLSKTKFYNRRLYEHLTLSANTYLNRFFSASLSYSMINGAFNNIGLGVSLRGGPVQFYIVSDNILGAFKPQHTRYLNACFGLNLSFGKIFTKESRNSENDFWEPDFAQ